MSLVQAGFLKKHAFRSIFALYETKRGTFFSFQADKVDECKETHCFRLASNDSWYQPRVSHVDAMSRKSLEVFITSMRSNRAWTTWVPHRQDGRTLLTVIENMIYNSRHIDLCVNQEDMVTMEPFSDDAMTQEDRIYIVMYNERRTAQQELKATCYSRQSLLEMFEKQEKVYQWSIKRSTACCAYVDAPVYADMLGSWYVGSTRSRIQHGTVFIQVPIGNHTIGSGFHVSAMHGDMHMLYGLYALSPEMTTLFFRRELTLQHIEHNQDLMALMTECKKELKPYGLPVAAVHGEPYIHAVDSPFSVFSVDLIMFIQRLIKQSDPYVRIRRTLTGYLFTFTWVRALAYAYQYNSFALDNTAWIHRPGRFIMLPFAAIRLIVTQFGRTIGASLKRDTMRISGHIKPGTQWTVPTDRAVYRTNKTQHSRFVYNVHLTASSTPNWDPHIMPVMNYETQSLRMPFGDTEVMEEELMRRYRGRRDVPRLNAMKASDMYYVFVHAMTPHT